MSVFHSPVDLMKFESQIRFGICEGDCTSEKVVECGNKCPLNNFLDQFVSMMDLIELGYIFFGLSTSGKESGKGKKASGKTSTFFWTE